MSGVARLNVYHTAYLLDLLYRPELVKLASAMQHRAHLRVENCTAEALTNLQRDGEYGCEERDTKECYRKAPDWLQAFQDAFLSRLLDNSHVHSSFLGLQLSDLRQCIESNLPCLVCCGIAPCDRSQLMDEV